MKSFIAWIHGVALSLGGLRAAGERGRSERCRSNLRQISLAAQALANSATEQASTLEEVTATLHEIAAMAQANAEHAAQVQALSEESKLAVDRGVESLGRLVDAIGQIKTASDATEIGRAHV